MDIAQGRSVRSPALCLLTDGLLLTGSTKGVSVRAVLVQVAHKGGLWVQW